MKVSFKSLFSINSVSLTLGTILAVILLFRSQVPVFELIELKTYDLRFLSRGQVQPSPTVVLVLIDEKSLAVEGRWPWPRSKFATLVDTLSRDGAKVIGFARNGLKRGLLSENRTRLSAHSAARSGSSKNPDLGARP